MTATLTISEVLHQKKATEQAIAKLLQDLKEQTGCTVNGISTTQFICSKETKLFVQIDINY